MKKNELTINVQDTELVCLRITIRKTTRRSWRWFREYRKRKQPSIPTIDLRKSSKNNIPLYLQLNCDKCGKNILEIRKIKDFPLKDKKCKCGKGYLIKWDILPTSKTTHAYRTIN